MDRVAPFFMTHGVDVFVLKRDVKIQPTAGSFVHVLMLSNQAVCGLPRLRAPGVVPCIISFLQAIPLFPHGVTIVC